MRTWAEYNIPVDMLSRALGSNFLPMRGGKYCRLNLALKLVGAKAVGIPVPYVWGLIGIIQGEVFFTPRYIIRT